MLGASGRPSGGLKAQLITAMTTGWLFFLAVNDRKISLRVVWSSAQLDLLLTAKAPEMKETATPFESGVDIRVVIKRCNFVLLVQIIMDRSEARSTTNMCQNPHIAVIVPKLGVVFKPIAWQQRESDTITKRQMIKFSSGSPIKA
jgi:hypothetical protein